MKFIKTILAGSGGSKIVLDIDSEPFLKLVKKEADKVAKDQAGKLIAESRQYLMTRAKSPTGKLASEIKVERSKFIGGGYAVEAQGPGNYDRFYATFVELGSIRNPEPIPFLRRPLEARKPRILEAYKDLFD